jgi:hypothetical protein
MSIVASTADTFPSVAVVGAVTSSVLATRPFHDRRDWRLYCAYGASLSAGNQSGEFFLPASCRHDRFSFQTQ